MSRFYRTKPSVTTILSRTSTESIDFENNPYIKRATRNGTIIHNVLEHYYLTGQVGYNTLEKCKADLCKERGDSNFDDPRLTVLFAKVQGYLLADKTETLNIGGDKGIELKMIGEHEGGTADRILVDPDKKIGIQDYKTCRAKTPGRECMQRYTKQLGAYWGLLKEVHDIEADKGVLTMFGWGSGITDPVNIEFNKEQLKTFYDDFVGCREIYYESGLYDQDMELTQPHAQV